MGQHGGRVGDGGGLGNGAGDVADTVVDHALLNVAGVVMGGLMEGLNGPHIVADVHNDGALLHGADHLPVDHKLGGVLGPAHAVIDHVDLRQQLFQVVAVGDLGVDLLVELLADVPQRADVDIHDRHPGPQGVEHGHTGPAHGAAADDQGLDAGGSAQAVDEFSLSSVDGQQGVQPHQRPQLAGRLAVGGAVPVGVLGGKRDALAVQQRLYLLGVGGGVDAGEHNLILPQQGEFTGLQLLHLGDKVAGPIDLLHGVQQLGALLGVLLVREAGARARAPLHIDLVAVAHNGLHFRRSHDGAVLARLNIL